MSTQITIPDFNFSAFYYAEILEALMTYKRQHVPELTEELDEEPFIQFLRAVALVGHLNNVLIDLVANESTLPTAKLVDSVRNMLKLIGYNLSPASPAQVDIVYELSKVFTVSREAISEAAQVSTKREGANPIVVFEALESLMIEPTNELSYVYASENDVLADFTTEANSTSTPTDDWSPWSSPSNKDCIYWGHKNIMWDKLSLYITTPSENITGVWEFYDGVWRKTPPTSVTNTGSELQIDLTSLLGSQNRQGTLVRIQLNESSAYEFAYSTWAGTNIATIGLLGQTIPSTDENDYSIGSDWTIFNDVEDGTANFTQSGDVSYTLPQSITKNWIKTTINNQEAFWIRYRIISAISPTVPVIAYAKIDEGKQYAIRLVTQGQSHTDEPLGNSTGLPNQRLAVSQENFIWNSEIITVDGETWSRVDNFLESKSGDKHYIVELTTNDKAVIGFGDGVGGKIPPLGVGTISASYRYGAHNDGNVGANTIIIDKTGLTFINKIWNPRQAVGWSEAQGANEESLERAKIEAPASLRTREVALGPRDIEILALAYTDENGARPFSRAFAFEEGYGPKTIELVVVAKGGGYASATQLENLQEYFNGNKYSHPPVQSHLIANQQVIVTNYTQKTISLDITVYGNVTQSAVLGFLQGMIQPEALKDDGITWEWNFGNEISSSRINHEIFSFDDSVTKVIVNSADVILQPRELPMLGTPTIEIINS